MDCLRDKWGSTNDNSALAIALLDDHDWYEFTNYGSCMPFYLLFSVLFWGFFVIYMYFAVHVCSFCFIPVPTFFSTFWISTRRNTLVASVLVTGTLFFIKSLFKVFKLIHQIYIKWMIYNKNPIIFGPLSIKKYQLHKLVNNEVLDYRLS